MSKILLVSHKFPPHAIGGVEVYTHHLAHALREHHQVSVFYRHDDVRARGGRAGLVEHDEAPAPGTAGLQTRRVSLNPQGLGASVTGEFLGTFLNRQIEASFARFLEETQPNLVHFQHVMSLSARLPGLARRAGVPALLTLHDYWFLCGNSQLLWPDARPCRGKAMGMNCVRCAAAARFPSPLAAALKPALAPLFLYRDRMVRQAAFQARQLIAPSHFLIEQYVAAGFPAERFVYLENGLPLDHIEAAPDRSRLWGATDPMRVTYLGSLSWQKGVHILVQACAGLPPGAVRLRIWGDPTVFPEYSRRLRGLLAHPEAVLMGRVENERVGEVLADSDVLVVPSLWYENSPIVIQEARAARVPVVASGHGALAEKVRHQIDGLLFPPGDVVALRQALQRLVEEPELLPALRHHILPIVQMQDHVAELESIYESTIWR
jgi:glycosyltransferase involved in cell wall biosynthesis